MLDLEGLNLASRSLLNCMRPPISITRVLTRGSLPKTKQFLVRVGDILERYSSPRL